MGNAQIFYRECKKICSERIKGLGFKAYKMHYYRVIDKSVQMFCFYAYGGRREVRFDIRPLGHQYMSREWEGELWLNDFVPDLDVEILLADNDIESTERYFAQKICDALENIILSGFEMIRTTEDAYCLKRFWLENCMLKHSVSIKYIYEDYMWYLQLGQYEKAKNLLLRDIDVWKRENNIVSEQDITDENDMIIYRNLMRPVHQWCEKDDKEIEKEIKRLETQNLEILKWKNELQM